MTIDAGLNQFPPLYPLSIPWHAAPIDSPEAPKPSTPRTPRRSATKSSTPQHASIPARDPLRLVCHEVWGGNRPVFGAIELPGIRGVLYSRPCDGRNGGDVHYLTVCRSGVLSRICLADVAGHGEQVASISSAMQAHLARSIDWPDQRRVLRVLNKRLYALGIDAMTTAAAISYYAPRGKLSYSYAGHEPGWLFRRAAGSWSRLRIDANPAALRDLPLGVSQSMAYSRRSLSVNPGDRLLLVTDGVLETQSPSGHQFGHDRLASVLAHHRDASCPQLSAEILRSLHEFAERSNLAHDDVSFLLLEFQDEFSAPAIWHALKNRLLRPRGNSDSYQSFPIDQPRLPTEAA